MLRTLTMPRMGDEMKRGVVHLAHVREGDSVSPRTPLFDVRVDLDGAFQSECPPVFYFTIVSLEAGIVRRLLAARGDAIEVGEKLAIFSTTADEAIEGDASPMRSLRIATAGIQVDPWEVPTK